MPITPRTPTTIPVRIGAARRMRFLAAGLILAGGFPVAGQPPLSPVPRPGPEYGPSLPILRDVGTGPVRDAAISGNRLYAIGAGQLFIADLSKPEAPAIVAKLGGLGNNRQVVVRDGVAYITAREDGLFLVDVGRPQQPVLLSRYDTIELATGIAVSGKVAVVACRHAGIEFVDVTNPRRPAHLSTLRVGEAQSVAAKNGYVYAGVWAGRELVVIDARNPRKPAVAGRASLDGYGDGVAVRGAIAYVATGHHSSAGTEPGGPGYGRGHGLELLDVSNPAQPRFLSRVKMPAFYRQPYDLWGVELAGRYAFVADTFNGLFVVDVLDPRRPKVVAHRQLPRVDGRDDPSPVGGLAVFRDHVYVAGAWSDLHVAAAKGLASPPQPEPDTGLAIPPFQPAQPDPRFLAYRPEGQVHAAVLWREEGNTPVFVVAAGSAGLHVVRLRDRFERLAQHPTVGIATDAAVHGDAVYVAEGDAGLSVWKPGPKGELRRAGAFVPKPGEPVRQVVLDRGGRFALLGAGLNRLRIVRLAPQPPFPVVMEDQKPGIFYERPIALQVMSDRYPMVQWSRGGLNLYDLLASSGPAFTGFQYPHRITSENGAAPFGAGWLVTYGGGYFLLSDGDTRPPEDIGVIFAGGRDLSGKPTVFGNVLFTSSPYSGAVSAVDVSHPLNPRLIGALDLPEHNGFVTRYRDRAIVPAGYYGLLAWKYGDEPDPAPGARR